jgi:hypothetical protein
MNEYWNARPEEFDGDLAVGPLYGDRPPTRGIAGWADWRLGQPVAQALLSGRVKAQPGERFLIAGRPPFLVQKIILVGCPSPAADAETSNQLAEAYAAAFKDLGAKRVLVESPATDHRSFFKLLNDKTRNFGVELVPYLPEVPCRI